MKQAMKYAVLLMLLMASSGLAEVRTWVGKNGVSLNAEFAGLESGKDGVSLVLCKQDGSLVRTKPQNLCSADQEYVNSIIAAHRTAAHADPEDLKPVMRQVQVITVEPHKRHQWGIPYVSDYNSGRSGNSDAANQYTHADFKLYKKLSRKFRNGKGPMVALGSQRDHGDSSGSVVTIVPTDGTSYNALTGTP